MLVGCKPLASLLFCIHITTYIVLEQLKDVISEGVWRKWAVFRSSGIIIRTLKSVCAGMLLFTTLNLQIYSTFSIKKEQNDRMLASRGKTKQPLRKLLLNLVDAIVPILLCIMR